MINGHSPEDDRECAGPTRAVCYDNCHNAQRRFSASWARNW